MTEQEIIQKELEKHGVTPVKEQTPTVAKNVAPVKEEKKKEPSKTTSKVTASSKNKEHQVTLQLSQAEVDGLEREARLLGISWQDHLGDIVMNTLDSRVAKQLITGPSFAAKQVRGPSNIGTHYHGA